MAFRLGSLIIVLHRAGILQRLPVTRAPQRLACRTGGLAGPARYTKARARRENEREALSRNHPPVTPPVVTPLCFCSSNRSPGERFVLIGYFTSRGPRMT